MKHDQNSPHRRQAARFYRSAASATTQRMKDWLLDQAEQHENLAELAGEPELELAEAGC
jgi:hypothetical protein